MLNACLETPVFCFALQVLFVSNCRSVWDCGSVALDDISVSQGDCELTAGQYLQYLTDMWTTARAETLSLFYYRNKSIREYFAIEIDTMIESHAV